MIFFTTVLTINAIYFMSIGNSDNLNISSNSYSDVVKKGNISSLITLGEMYEKGHFVNKDLEKSQAFFKKAINYINKEMDDTVFDHDDLEEKELSESESFKPKAKKQITNISKTSNKKNISKKTYSKKSAQKETKNKSAKNIIVAEKTGSNVFNDHISYDDLETIDIDDNDIATEEIDPVIIDDDNLFYEKLDTVVIDENFENEIIAVEDKKIITIQTASKEVLSKNSFTSNPCNTAAARYIARCLKLNRKR
jgi:hypothetical protein